jgi:quercetin dioxygenase-like cupin family protein
MNELRVFAGVSVMKLANRLVWVLSALPMTVVSNAAGGDRMGSAYNTDLAALPADHPRGTKATVTLVSLERTLDLHNRTVSTFVVDYAPGGSAVLQRAPSSGYVMVHVLSGAITAWAWEAGVGMYRAGETWAEPAFAYDITTRNASTNEPARALVVLITGPNSNVNSQRR